MSTPPGPPSPPPYAAGLLGPDPRRPRPRARWFVLGGGLLVAALAAAISLFVWVLSSFLAVDATVPADGSPHRVTATAGAGRVLWVHPGEGAQCRVADPASGDELRLSAVDGRFQKSDGSGEWIAAQRFEPTSDQVEVTCDPAAGEVQVGPEPSIGSLVGAIALTIGVPLVLGAAGLIVLLVTAVRWATGRPRD